MKENKMEESVSTDRRNPFFSQPLDSNPWVFYPWIILLGFSVPEYKILDLSKFLSFRNPWVFSKMKILAEIPTF